MTPNPAVGAHIVRAAPRYSRVASCLCLALFLSHCGGDGPTEPNLGQPGVHVLFGAGVTDTIDTKPLQALVIEVRKANGELARGVAVRFTAQPPTDPTRQNEPAIFLCALASQFCGPTAFNSPPGFADDTTDAQGRAKVAFRLGHVAGQAVVRLTVTQLAMEDSATFTVTPGAIVRVRAPAADTALYIGASATLRGRVVDRYENTRPETPTITAGTGSVIALDVATSLVTAQDIGAQWLFVRHASSIDSTRVSVVPTGRLVAWSDDGGAVRLVNTDGSNERTLVTGVSSDLGVFPRFDPTRQRVTLHAGATSFGGPPSRMIVTDTTGSSRRILDSTIGFRVIMAQRQLADGALLVVALRATDPESAEHPVWRVATDNSITFVAALPDLMYGYGAADISHDGTRVVYAVPGEMRVFSLSTGAITVLDTEGTSPTWSSQDDRVAYLVRIPGVVYDSFLDGSPVVINADGTGRRALGSSRISSGLAWSPDSQYIVGRGGNDFGLRLVRVSDGANVLLRLRNSAGFSHDYWQPDWR